MKKKKLKIRTDLALELKDDVEIAKTEGIEISTTINEDSDIKETIIRVTNQRGERMLGKPIGTYVTLESEWLRKYDESIHEPFITLLTKHLKNMLGSASRVLVVGLGNRNVTPDALGPHVIDNLYITRHLLREGVVCGVREISAVCPGVMAQTGIETVHMLKAICKEIKPDAIVTIDALAAREASRLNSTIQICDTGISPGSGVGNDRKKISEKNLGVKVIAIGVPTVISVSSLIHAVAKDADIETLPETILSMFVTPNDIDESIKRVSYTISEALNRLFVGFS